MYHDNRKHKNPLKVTKENRWILLVSNVYGRAKAKFDAVDDTSLALAKGIELVVAAIYKRDPIPVSLMVF